MASSVLLFGCPSPQKFALSLLTYIGSCRYFETLLLGIIALSHSFLVLFSCLKYQNFVPLEGNWSTSSCVEKNSTKDKIYYSAFQQSQFSNFYSVEGTYNPKVTSESKIKLCFLLLPRPPRWPALCLYLWGLYLSE